MSNLILVENMEFHLLEVDMMRSMFPSELELDDPGMEADIRDFIAKPGKKQNTCFPRDKQNNMLKNVFLLFQCLIYLRESRSKSIYQKRIWRSELSSDSGIRNSAKKLHPQPSRTASKFTSDPTR